MSIRRGEPPTLVNRSEPIRPRSPAEMLEPSRAPERPKGSKAQRDSSAGRILGATSSLMTTLVLAMVVLGSGALLINQQFKAAGPLKQERLITISKGEGRIEIATRLEREGFISNRWTFLLNHLFHSMMRPKSPDLKAGEYKFGAGASMEKILTAILKGRGFLYKLSLPEGLTSQQMIQRIKASPDLTGEIAEIPSEGSLLPDTYSFAKGMTRGELLAQMQQQQAAILNEAWQNRAENLPLQTKEEALILASIVEKETGVPEERGRVAAVFINRLRKKMRLQSDPTIIYGIAGGKGSLGRPITRQDKASKTPYNTYHVDGLPPTPICNPGRDAIHAVLNPPATEDLYFVANGTGGHTFTTNYKDHNVAVAKWRQIERLMRAEAKKKQAAGSGSGSGETTDPSAGAAQTARAEDAAASVGIQLINSKDNKAGGDDLPLPALDISPAAFASVSDGGASVPLPVRKPRQ